MAGKKVYPHELIGEKIEVVRAENKANLGLKGKVVDETKMTLKIQEKGIVKTLLKNGIMIKIVRSGKIISGREINKRPEERIKG